MIVRRSWANSDKRMNQNLHIQLDKTETEKYFGNLRSIKHLKRMLYIGRGGKSM
jgi:hypothetical protein